MKRIFFLIAILAFNSADIYAQKYYTKNGHVSFFSKAAMENIKAENNQVLTVLDTQTGEMQFSILIKSFHFPKSLMEVHFNENYLESDKFPTAGFKGSITNLKDILFTKDGIYKATVSGAMSIHGVTQKFNTSGTITVTGNKISIRSIFFITLADYNISIPKIVMDKVAESVEITIHSELDQKL